MLGGQLLCQGEIDLVDLIRALVTQGRLATVMPVSVIKGTRASEDVALSEVSGAQLSHMLILATRIERQLSRALQVMREMVEAEFARLTLGGVFAFGVQ